MLLSLVLAMAPSIDAPLSTNGVTGGGITLFVPGSLVLIETRAVPLCREGSSYYASSSRCVVPDPVTLVVADCMSDLVNVVSCLDCCIPSIILFMVLIAPN